MYINYINVCYYFIFDIFFSTCQSWWDVISHLSHESFWVDKTRPRGSAIFIDCQDAKLLAEAKAINRSLSVGVPKSTCLYNHFPPDPMIA